MASKCLAVLYMFPYYDRYYPYWPYGHHHGHHHGHGCGGIFNNLIVGHSPRYDYERHHCRDHWDRYPWDRP